MLNGMRIDRRAGARRRAAMIVLGALLAGCEKPPAAPEPNVTRLAPAVVSSAAPATAPATAAAWAHRPGAPTGTFLDRDERADLRLVSYNVMWNTIFPAVDAELAAKFRRVVVALNPDILTLQEIGLHPRDRTQPGARRWTADDARQLMNQLIPPAGGDSWYAHQGSDNVILSKYPLKMTATQTEPPAEREQAIALVDLPDDQFKVDLYVLNNHFKCCDGEKNDPLRQQQADAIAAWIRDARTPGGHIDLPTGTAIAVVGDLNIVGAFEPVQTLLKGDIQDEQSYGPDFEPDWDDTALADLHPVHNAASTEDWTWRDDTSGYKPGRLDFILYTDSILEPVKNFVLNTMIMSEADLAATGLRKFDVCQDDLGRQIDHLPLVVDFRFAPTAVNEEPAPGE